MMPHAGGQYVYLREAYGPLSGFLYGWTLSSSSRPGPSPRSASPSPSSRGRLVPWFGEKHVLCAVLGLTGHRPPSSWPSSVIVVLTWLTCGACGRQDDPGRLHGDQDGGARRPDPARRSSSGPNAVGDQRQSGRLLEGRAGPSWRPGRSLSVEPLDGIHAPGGHRRGHGRLAVLLRRLEQHHLHRRRGQEPEAEHPPEPGPRDRRSSSCSISWPTWLTSSPCPSREPRGADVIARGIQFAQSTASATAAAEMIFGARGRSSWPC